MKTYVVKTKVSYAPTILDAVIWCNRKQGGVLAQYARDYGIDLHKLQPNTTEGFMCRQYPKNQGGGRDFLANTQAGKTIVIPALTEKGNRLTVTKEQIERESRE